jgi:flagellar assembly protein FliH
VASGVQHTQARVYGNKIALGEPLQIHGDAEMRAEIEASLEFLATQHLLEAEDKANKLITKAKTEAAALLAKAKAQAKELLQQMQDQVDGIRDAAHEEGFKAGFQEGYADATEQVEQETVEMLKEANTLVEGAYQAEKLVLKQFEKQALALIRHLVRRIVQREMTDSPEALTAMIQQATESLYLSGKVQVVVSAQIIQDLRDYAARTRDSLDGMHRFEFIADPNLDTHQIYIIGQEGCFDLSPETQLQQLTVPLESELTLPRTSAPPEPAQAGPETTSAPIPEPMEGPAVDLAIAEFATRSDESTPAVLAEEPSVSTVELDGQSESPLAAVPEDTAVSAPEEAVAIPPELAEASGQAKPYEFPALDAIPPIDSAETPQPGDAASDVETPTGMPDESPPGADA